MLTPDQHQLAIEYRELMQSIAKTETQVAALRRFAALPPETVAAVKDEASAVGRLAYEALEGTAARIADTLQSAVDRAKRDVETAHWQVIRKAHDRLNRVVAQEPLCDACHWLVPSLVCGGSASVPRDHDAAPADGKRNRADQATLRTHYGRTRPITRRDHSLETVEERSGGATARQSTRTPLNDTRVRESSNA